MSYLVSGITIADAIQIAILLVLTATLIAALFQLRTQNTLLKAQVITQRLRTYWRTYEPVSDEQAKEMEFYPDDYMDPHRFYEAYAGKSDKIKKYIGILMIYEYLAFSYSLKDIGGAEPVGDEWIQHWARDLAVHPEFRDVHEWHRDYYPAFAKTINKIFND